MRKAFKHWLLAANLYTQNVSIELVEFVHRWGFTLTFAGLRWNFFANIHIDGIQDIYFTNLACMQATMEMHTEDHHVK